MVFMLCICGNNDAAQDEAEPAGTAEEVTETEDVATETEEEAAEDTEEAEESEEMMRFYINDTELEVTWEDNDSVSALKEIASVKPLTINMSMYGGFEQVGAIGQDLPRSDKQTTTSAGDIVLYSGNQIVVFYGSNSWSYTRLGHIEGKTQEELTGMLGTADVTVTIDNAE
ncbi:MAG: hypothetical protein J6I83_06300 [Firmicutes bacterium]|nr:hypothetical protein [Bacillota bacterium]